MGLHVSLLGRKHLSSEIYRQLRQAILDGRLRPGARVPAAGAFVFNGNLGLCAQQARGSFIAQRSG